MGAWVVLMKGLQRGRFMNRYAVLADIHGNIWALEAILADARRRSIRSFINLGDTLYGPLEPAATAECLMALDLVSIQGNEDRVFPNKSIFDSRAKII
jgi:predicted phosphodiesterase